MAHLKPTLKERKRYILFKINSEREVEKEDVSKLVTKAGLQFLGEFGMARACIQFLAETWNGKTGIISVNHNYVDETKTALALVKEYEGKKIAIETLKTSGSISKLKGE